MLNDELEMANRPELNTQTLAGAVAAGIQLTLQVLSCLAHIHKVAFCVASWNRSAQPPPPLAMGDERIDMNKRD